MANDVNSLAYTKWNYKYHIVFAPKYRRKVFFGEKRGAIGKILRELCEWKKVEIHAAEIAGKYSSEGVGIKFYGILEGERVV